MNSEVPEIQSLDPQRKEELQEIDTNKADGNNVER
jgi:hypothetical protein